MVACTTLRPTDPKVFMCVKLLPSEVAQFSVGGFSLIKQITIPHVAGRVSRVVDRAILGAIGQALSRFVLFVEVRHSYPPLPRPPPYARKSASQAVYSRMHLIVLATRRAPHGKAYGHTRLLPCMT